MNARVPMHTQLSRSYVSRPFTARYFVRGGMNQPCLVIECADVEQVIANGGKTFSSFSARNPWIFSDSIRGMAWVFLDPEPSVNERKLQ
jgi:hypothetical protein